MLQFNRSTKEAKGRINLRREDGALFLMALPAILYLLIFAYLPMAGLVMAFQDLNISKGVFSSPFVGFKNFEFLFSTTDAWVITRNTVVYNLVFIIVNLAISVTLSLMLSSLRSSKFAKTTQTVFMMPYFLSYAVVAIVVNAFLHRDSGVVNLF